MRPREIRFSTSIDEFGYWDCFTHCCSISILYTSRFFSSFFVTEFYFSIGKALQCSSIIEFDYIYSAGRSGTVGLSVDQPTRKLRTVKKISLWHPSTPSICQRINPFNSIEWIYVYLLAITIKRCENRRVTVCERKIRGGRGERRDRPRKPGKNLNCELKRQLIL